MWHTGSSVSLWQNTEFHAFLYEASVVVLRGPQYIHPKVAKNGVATSRYHNTPSFYNH